MYFPLPCSFFSAPCSLSSSSPSFWGSGREGVASVPCCVRALRGGGVVAGVPLLCARPSPSLLFSPFPPPSHPASEFFTVSFCQRFRKGVGGRGLAINKPPKRAQKVPQKCVPLLLRGHRKKGAEKRPESLVFEGRLRANPLCPPTPFRNFWFCPLSTCMFRESLWRLLWEPGFVWLGLRREVPFREWPREQVQTCSRSRSENCLVSLCSHGLG